MKSLIVPFARLLKLLNPSRMVTYPKMMVTFPMMIKSLRPVQNPLSGIKGRTNMEGVEGEASWAHPTAILNVFLSRLKQLYHLFEIVHFLSQLAGKSW